MAIGDVFKIVMQNINPLKITYFQKYICVFTFAVKVPSVCAAIIYCSILDINDYSLNLPLEYP